MHDLYKKALNQSKTCGVEIALNGSSYFRTFEGECLGQLVSSLTKSHLVPHSNPVFFAIVSRFIRLLISGEPDHLQRLYS